MRLMRPIKNSYFTNNKVYMLFKGKATLSINIYRVFRQKISSKNQPMRKSETINIPIFGSIICVPVPEKMDEVTSYIVRYLIA